MKMNQDMDELITISENNGKKAVSARDLHAFLESKRDFSNWIKDRIDKYGFVENQDFQVFNNFGENPKGGRPTIEYALSINMAKELSMIENNERGRQARKYFIACEEQVTKRELSRKELLLMALQAEEEKERLEIENRQKQLLLEQKTEQLDESKEWYSIKRWAKEHNMNWRSIKWRKMKALSYELGYEIKKVFDANYGQVNIYNVKVFEAYL